MIKSIDIAYDALYWMQNTHGKRMTELLKAGGCPAKNTKCAFLRAGVCVKEMPQLSYNKGKLGCWSYAYRID